jgi:hypothetical protein
MSDIREAKPVDPHAEEAALERMDAILDEIVNERRRQRDKGYDAAHDDARTVEGLGGLVALQTCDHEIIDNDLIAHRKAFIRAAAVAVAAVESIDRRMAVLAKARAADDGPGGVSSRTEGPYDRTGAPRPMEG